MSATVLRKTYCIFQAFLNVPAQIYADKRIPESDDCDFCEVAIVFGTMLFRFASHSAILHNSLIYGYLAFLKIAYTTILNNINILIFNQLTKIYSSTLSYTSLKGISQLFLS